MAWREMQTHDLRAVSSPGSQNRSADFEQARIALIAAARRLRAASLCAFDLLLADEGEGSTKPLVLDNRGLWDLAQFVKGPIGQVDAPIADR